ncbi:MAG: DMT family transporter [Planctomycetes bacterium]|nr:DMT family transporter [Planctomycetota bacterium]
MPPTGHRVVPQLVLLGLILIWSASYVVSKLALGSLTAPALVATRFWLAILCVLPLVRRGLATQLRATLWPGITTGIALGSGYLLQMQGLRLSTASMGGLIAGLIVPLVALGGFLVLGGRLGGRAALGLALAIAGIVLVCDASGGSWLGNGLLIGSSVSYAAHVLLLSFHGRRVPLVAFTLWQLVVVASAGTVQAALDGEIAAQPELGVAWSPALLAELAYLGVLATGLAILVQGRVQHRIPSTQVALLFATQPLLAALCGWFWLDDHLTAMQLAGGGLIIIGVVVTSLAR